MSTFQNPVGWFEIYVSDLARAVHFYEVVFKQELLTMPTEDQSITGSFQSSVTAKEMQLVFIRLRKLTSLITEIATILTDLKINSNGQPK